MNHLSCWRSSPRARRKRKITAARQQSALTAPSARSQPERRQEARRRPPGPAGWSIGGEVAQSSPGAAPASTLPIANAAATTRHRPPPPATAAGRRGRAGAGRSRPGRRPAARSRSTARPAPAGRQRAGPREQGIRGVLAGEDRHRLRQADGAEQPADGVAGPAGGDQGADRRERRRDGQVDAHRLVEEPRRGLVQEEQHEAERRQPAGTAPTTTRPARRRRGASSPILRLPQPERDVGGLHRLVDDAAQVVGQAARGRPRRAARRRRRPGCAPASYVRR